MIPLRDHYPSGSFPLITRCLIAVNIVVFLYLFSLSEQQLDTFINSYALIPAVILSGNNLKSLITSMFLHSSFGHLFGNMLFLNIFGDNLEHRLGHLRFLIFYFISGLGAALAQIVISPSSLVPILGASGAIAGVMGGYLFFFPNHPIDILFSFGWVVRDATVPAWSMLFYWFFFQLISGLGSLALPQEGGIAYFAHLGGFLTGFLFAFVFKKRTTHHQRFSLI